MERYEVEKIIKLLESGVEYFAEDEPKGEYLVFGYDSIQKNTILEDQIPLLEVMMKQNTIPQTFRYWKFC
jgi:hypothetical protein